MSLTRRIFEEKRRLIYPIVAALVLNAAIYAAVVYPLSLKVTVAEQSAQAAMVASAAAHRDFESAKRTVTGKVAADAELKTFYTEVLPPDQSAAQRITYLRRSNRWRSRRTSATSGPPTKRPRTATAGWASCPRPSRCQGSTATSGASSTISRPRRSS